LLIGNQGINHGSARNSKMKTVLLRGPVLTHSGYGTHCRQIARWLLSKPVQLHVQALPWGETPWIIDPTRHDGLIGKIMTHTGTPPPQCDVSVQLQLPNEWDPKLGKFNIGITASVETDKCNPEWVSACNNMDHIVVPSEHAKKNLTNSGLIYKPISVIPEAYPDCMRGNVSQELDLKLTTPFNFLIFGQLTGNNPHNDRKNLFYTIRWLCEAFKDDPEVGIVLKSNAGKLTKIDRKIMTGLLTQLLNDVRKGPFPKFHLLHGDMSDEEVTQLYHTPSIKALVTLTRGEGFGLPILEAAACGLPVIATNWSGHLDFLNHGKFVGIDYQLRETHETRIDNRIFMKGAKWAEPIEDDFKRRIKKFKVSPTTPREWAADLKKTIQEKYSFESIASIYNETFKDVL
jgi:glycosyltransferase involved in cell wall biosynthesis